VDFSQSVIVFICILFFGYAWTFLFRKRPASQHVPEGVPLFTAGFYKIFQTSRTILLHHSAIKWFLISVCFTEAATYTFSTIAITYMTSQLNFTSKENGVCILILLLFGVPGTRLAAWTNHINPIRSLQACLLAWIATTSIASLVMKNPGQQNTAYVFAAFWGLCLGWIHPTEKTLYCTIIPRGQEAELMGTYICAGQILSWVPSLVFSVLNESGFSMRFGLFSLSFYFIASFFILFMVGDYEEAVAHARAFDHADSSRGEGLAHASHRRKNSHKHPEADFVIISDYEEAVAHKQSMSVMGDESTEMSSRIVMPCG
jgi:MFS-type transporter involved in bile tolerance (Atg22 family)